MATEGLRPCLTLIVSARPALLPGLCCGEMPSIVGIKFPLEELGGQALIRQLLTIRMEDLYAGNRLIAPSFPPFDCSGVELILH